MMKHLITFLLITFCLSITGQEILLHKKTEEILAEDDFGPNKKKYVHSMLSVGFNFGLQEENVSLIRGWSSFSLGYGVRTKRRLSNTFSLGYDVRCELNQYRYRPHERSLFQQFYSAPEPDSLLVDKLSYSSAQFAPYFRINMGKRGNHLGKYIDLSVYGELMITSSHAVKFKHPNDDQVNRSTLKTRRLKYTNKLLYGLEFRYGNSYYNVYLRYRANDLLNNKLKDDPRQPPACNAGLYLFLAR